MKELSYDELLKIIDDQILKADKILKGADTFDKQNTFLAGVAYGELRILRDLKRLIQKVRL